MERDIQCRLHLSTTSVQGVIYTVWEELTEDEVPGALKKSWCAQFERMYKGKEKMKTLCMLLYFDLEELPADLTLGYEIFAVKPYIPTPRSSLFQMPSLRTYLDERETKNLERPVCVNCDSPGQSSAYLGCPYRKTIGRAQYIRVTPKSPFSMPRRVLGTKIGRLTLKVLRKEHRQKAITQHHPSYK